MAYKLKLTKEFLNEMENICEYITNNLKEENASKRLRKKIIENINLLESSPKMFAKIEKNSKTKREYRRIVVDNYVILYTTDELRKNIYIAHIYYNKRNYIEDLL